MITVEIAERIGSPNSRTSSYYRLGVLVGGAGPWTEAVATLEHALAIARDCRTSDRLIDETGATTLTPLVLLDRAELARVEGDTAARRRLLEEAKALFAGLGAPMRVQQIDALLAAFPGRNVRR